jgi:uncharacterized membrane protein YfcA
MQRGAFDLEMILPLLAAVVVGGYLGSYMGSFRFSPRVVQKTMGVVIVVAIGFLIRKFL